MLIDALVSFLPVGSPPLSLVAAAGVAVVAPNVIDVIGQGVGQAPGNIIGNTTLFGADMGIGKEKLQIQANIGTAVTTSDACTVNMQLQGAPDTGATGGYLPGTWQTFAETGALTAAQLTANTILRLDWPVQFPPTLAYKPRFYRVVFAVPATLLLTAGTVTAVFPTFVRDDYAIKNQPNNYAVH
jgi:hypothetical protein